MQRLSNYYSSLSYHDDCPHSGLTLLQQINFQVANPGTSAGGRQPAIWNLDPVDKVSCFGINYGYP